MALRLQSVSFGDAPFKSYARITGRRLVFGLVPNSFTSERWSPLFRQVVQACMSKGKLLLMYSKRPSI
eukprot:Skav210982  [mRNA]  locus=scaffold1730:11297:11500:+ [translate_table: standard]